MRRELLQQEERMTYEETISLTTDAPVEYLPQQVSTGTQSDLSATDIEALEDDNE